MQKFVDVMSRQRRAVFAICLALSCCSAYAAQPAQADGHRQVPTLPTLTIGDLVAAPDKYDGKRLKLFAYSVVEFENHNLFATEQAYHEGDTEQCIGLAVSNSAFARREAINKQYKLVVGTFRAALCPQGRICASWCSKMGLTDVEFDDLSLRYWGHPEPSFSESEIAVNEKASDFAQLRSLADRILGAVMKKPSQGAAARSDLLTLFPADVRSQMSAALGDPTSRLHWLLFSDGASMHGLFSDRKSVSVDVFQMMDRAETQKRESSVAFLCFCKDQDCTTAAFNRTAWYYQSTADQSFCVRLTKPEHEWLLDPRQFGARLEENPEPQPTATMP